MTPFEKAYAAARRDWEQGRGGPTFSFNGKPYSVATREEAARQKERAQSPERGRSYGGRADTRADSSRIPGAGSAKAPAATGGGMSETRRNVANIVSALPAARAVGMAGKAMQASSAARAAAPAAKRVEPLMYTARGQGGKFTPGGSPPGGKTPMATSRKEPTLGTGKVGRSLPKGKYEPMEYTARAPGGKFRKSEGK